MFSSGDSDFYVPSEGGSFATAFQTPPQTPRKARKMIVEVVIPIPAPKSARRRRPRPASPVAEMTPPPTTKPRRPRVREVSPARSDSSISLGTHWHISPKKKRIYRRKRSAVDGEPAGPSRRRGRARVKPNPTIQTGQKEHIPPTQVDFPPPPLATPITLQSPPLATPNTLDSPPYPQPTSISPFKSRARSSAPGMNINLDSARLETIQAQEIARGYDIYHPLPTPPGSGSAKPRVERAWDTPPASSYSEPTWRTQVYASNHVGSSTGLGTRERERTLEEQEWRVSPSASWKDQAPLSPPMTDPSYPSFAEPDEAELGFLGAEVTKLARLGLQTALEKLVERYDFPLAKVSKLYRSKGCLEETERVLRQLRRTEDELQLMKSAAFGRE